jgi:uncharacterized protein (DUF1499 family)
MSGKKQLFLYFFLANVLALSGCAGNPPTDLGQFAPCPDSPNCVSTQATDEKHAIDPIPYSGTKTEAKKRLLKIIHSLPRARMVVDREDYLQVEFTSRILRFKDDTEFYLGIEDARIHFRSASRLGYSDLGVNRKRMETIRSRFISSGSVGDPKP